MRVQKRFSYVQIIFARVNGRLETGKVRDLENTAKRFFSPF